MKVSKPHGDGDIDIDIESCKGGGSTFKPAQRWFTSVMISPILIFRRFSFGNSAAVSQRKGRCAARPVRARSNAAGVEV